MKILVFVGVLAAGYVYLLTHTTDIAMSQLQQYNTAYQHATDQTDAVMAEAR